MNTASTIVPYLREKLNIEIGTQAWAKMFEILANFDLINSKNNQKWITLHLCEAPGGFISALNHFLVTRNNETENIYWQWFAQTLNPYYEHDETTAAMLIDDDRLIFHTIHENHWDFGIENSGNLMNQANIDHYISRFQPMGISFVSVIEIRFPSECV
jgi:cap2 methyltransferase